MGWSKAVQCCRQGHDAGLHFSGRITCERILPVVDGWRPRCVSHREETRENGSAQSRRNTRRLIGYGLRVAGNSDGRTTGSMLRRRATHALWSEEEVYPKEEVIGEPKLGVAADAAEVHTVCREHG